MFIDDQARLNHMLVSAKDATTFIRGRNQADLENDRMLCSAILRCLEVIGEAASRISRTFQDSHPEVPWAQIIGMRNRLIHAYYDVKLEIVWNTVT
jgi:uncharacterized protein with HEPN domain